MNSNILLNRFPEAVEVGGVVCPVDWGYRAMILIEICMYDRSRNDEQKVLDVLNIFYQKQIPDDPKEALERLMWFYRCGEERKAVSGNKGAAKKHIKRSYCFSQDAPYIYAAFLNQYQMDLSATKNKELHWWKFRALFESLNEDQKFCKIMYYRTASLAGTSNNKRKFLNEMKKLYALEDQSQDLDDRMRLSKRNADMKAYVRRRAVESYGTGTAKG